jgi:cytochrome d ubiquinol oxidase subunit I
LQQLFVLGVSAYHVRREAPTAEGRTMLPMTLWLLTVLVSLQILIGDLHGFNTREHQPVKLAAMEAPWDNRPTRAANPVRDFERQGSEKLFRHRLPCARQPHRDQNLDGGWLRWPEGLPATNARRSQFRFSPCGSWWAARLYGLLRTTESVSPSLTSFDVAISLARYMLVYLLI